MRAPFAWLLTVMVAGCFTPNLGDGSVACGANGLCPPKYFCHASDQRCYKTPEVSVVDMSMSEDGSGGPDLMSTDLAGADMTMCTKALCGARNCGRIPDECGGIETCGGGCPTNKICGGGMPGSPNICGGPQACTKKTACQTGQCGIISDGCADVLICAMCPVGQSCGSDHLCH